MLAEELVKRRIGVNIGGVRSLRGVRGGGLSKLGALVVFLSLPAALPVQTPQPAMIAELRVFDIEGEFPSCGGRRIQCQGVQLTCKTKVRLSPYMSCKQLVREHLYLLKCEWLKGGLCTEGSVGPSP
jgi:hypothetical protein